METIYVGIAGTIAGIIFGYLGYQKGIKDEATSIGKKDGALKTDIEYIKRRTDEVLLEQKDTNRVVGSLSERMVRVEESTKSAHKRIDEVESNCKDFRKER